jgi:probable F420-dependent oxidoreductase
MLRHVRFTLQLPTDHVSQGDEFVSAEAIAEMAGAAEQAGFDAAFVTDHPAPEDRWLKSGGHQALDPFVALSFVAAATTRLRVQTHVLVASYRNPFLAAKAIATLDVLSRGRVIVGIAAGYLEPEFAALGVDYAERNELSDEAILAMKEIWRGESLVLDGRHSGPPAHRAAAPVQRPHPAAWIGGNSRRAMRRAVELGDGWLPFPAPARMAKRVRTAAMESEADLAARSPSCARWRQRRAHARSTSAPRRSSSPTARRSSRPRARSSKPRSGSRGSASAG